MEIINCWSQNHGNLFSPISFYEKGENLIFYQENFKSFKFLSFLGDMEIGDKCLAVDIGSGKMGWIKKKSARRRKAFIISE